ncbi:MAG: pilus assembly PilX N-terminal domain-containing protein, partial [Actinobacteria bacterium]|nr:pilus assembly PilX N-terminal domain-containing protein [Actinomycetota bacterium]
MIKRKIRNKRTKNMLSNQKGMALLATLIFVFVLVSLSVALLTMTNNDTKLSTLQRESNKAFYLADAGIEDTLWKLNTSTADGGMGVDWYKEEPADYPDPGTATEYYQVTIIKDGVDAEGDAKIKITSTGRVIGGKFSSGKRSIEVTAEIDYIFKTIYDYAILAEKVILFQGDPGPNIVGDVHSNDDILVSPPDGDFVENYPGTATCGGDTNKLNPSNVAGGTIDIPFVDYESLRNKSDALGNTIVVDDGDGKKIIADNWGTETNPITGIHFIDGDLEVKEGAEVHVKNGAIIVTGEVYVKNGAIFNIYNDDDYIDPADPDTALALAAQGDIRIYAKSTIEKGVVQSVLADGITSEGFIELKNGCE